MNNILLKYLPCGFIYDKSATISVFIWHCHWAALSVYKTVRLSWSLWTRFLFVPEVIKCNGFHVLYRNRVGTCGLLCIRGLITTGCDNRLHFLIIGVKSVQIYAFGFLGTHLVCLKCRLNDLAVTKYYQTFHVPIKTYFRSYEKCMLYGEWYCKCLTRKAIDEINDPIRSL